jgi:hypothetical protein
MASLVSSSVLALLLDGLALAHSQKLLGRHDLDFTRRVKRPAPE